MKILNPHFTRETIDFKPPDVTFGIIRDRTDVFIRLNIEQSQDEDGNPEWVCDLCTFSTYDPDEQAILDNPEKYYELAADPEEEIKNITFEKFMAMVAMERG